MGSHLNQSIVCAGIVTYNPDLARFRQVLASVYSQVSTVYVYDNGSSNLDSIKELVLFHSNCELLIGCENKGIAYALNRIFVRASADGKEWVLTLDHDTICQSDMVLHLTQLIELNDIGIICPRVEYVNLAVREKGAVDTEFTDVPACMTSGSLTNVEAWNKIGGYSERLFIDYVDNDYCMRLRLNGYRIVRSNLTFMNHQLGNVKRRKVGPFEMADYQYSPLRIYYITRNSIWHLRTYWKHLNVLKNIAAIAGRTAIFFALYRKDEKRMSSLRKGVREGLSGSRCLWNE